jgi:hypothetical protein
MTPITPGCPSTGWGLSLFSSGSTPDPPRSLAEDTCLATTIRPGISSALHHNASDMTLTLTLTLAGILAAATSQQSTRQPAPDTPFRQAVSIQVPIAPDLQGATFQRLRIDADGIVYVLTDRGVARVFEGTLALDRSYRPLATLPRDIAVQEATGHLYYLFDDRFLTNRSAGVPEGRVPEGGFDRIAVAANGTALLDGDSRTAIVRNGTLVEVDASDARGPGHLFAHEGRFYKATPAAVHRLDGDRWVRIHAGDGITTLAFRGPEMLVGTTDGYYGLNPETGAETIPRQRRLPVPHITSLVATTEAIWAGSPHGAFSRAVDGEIRYYASRRWLPDDEVVDLGVGPDGEVHVLTRTGLSRVAFRTLTLAGKARFYEQKIRDRHIRYGFVAERRLPIAGDLTTSEMVDTDNDGLWTSYYLASQAFRYAVTGDASARRHAWEAFEAFERLLSVNPLDGFPSRTFERTGFKFSDVDRWRPSDDPSWEWKGHTSSDEVVGHIFGAAVLHETATHTDEERQRIARFIDAIVSHIIRNDYYLIDVDGQPTLWGRWNPEYVNWYPHSIVDRRLNSAEIVAALHLAHHLTGRDIYLSEARRLMTEHGYLDNIMASMAKIDYTEGYVFQGKHDMGSGWNHSDDQLAFLTYWVLYRFAPTDDLKRQFAAAIEDHWRIERVERSPLWNFVYASTGATAFDLDEALWTLREWPLDLIRWNVKNSHRQDLTFLPRNFRNQQVAELLPPGERPVMRWNANPFVIDGGHGGHAELAGDEFLLPYWMGRYLRVIE